MLDMLVPGGEITHYLLTANKNCHQKVVEGFPPAHFSGASSKDICHNCFSVLCKIHLES